MSIETQHSLPLTANKLPAEPKSIIISVNPRAGAKSAIARLKPVSDALSSRGFDVFVTTDLEIVEEKVATLTKTGELRAVLAAGGDGTASAVRNVISPDTPMLPLPLGTECLLAKHLRQTLDPQTVCDTVESGLTAQIDIGRAGDRYFLLMLSIGIDAEVVHRLQETRVGNITHAAYLKPTWQAIRSYKYPELQVYCQDENSNGAPPVSCRWLLGFNLPCYARGLPFAPQANAADGLLDVCAFNRGHMLNSLRFLWQVIRSKHHDLPYVKMNQYQKLRIEAADGTPVAVQVDGDRAGRLPIEVEIVPHGLTLLVSEAGAERLGFQLPD